MEKEKKDAFIKEYNELCKKHGMKIRPVFLPQLEVIMDLPPKETKNETNTQ